MDAVSRDDIIHAIEQTVSFYGKSLDKTAIGFWLNGLRDKDPVMIKRALMMYAAKGKYAPKPVDILEIIDSLEGSRKSKLPPRLYPVAT